jgi:hypothetical protein
LTRCVEAGRTSFLASLIATVSGEWRTLVPSTGVKEEIPQHQQRPALADEVERARDGAPLPSV